MTGIIKGNLVLTVIFRLIAIANSLESICLEPHSQYHRAVEFFFPGVGPALGTNRKNV